MSEKIEAVKAALSGIRMDDRSNVLKRNSRDFYWYSPVLKRQLDKVEAELVVFPTSEEEVIRVLAACYENDVPVTGRGGGTGNYGQAMPLSGGVVMSLVELNAIKEIAPGRVVVEPGARLIDIDDACREHSGQELRTLPSTFRHATIGGFVGGGSGGVGSINWGGLREFGNILRLRVVTMEAEPRVLELTGMDIQKANHAYGTTGIITELEMPLAPSYDWAEVIVGFDGFMASTEYANGLARQDGILTKLVTAIAAPIPEQYFTPFRSYIPEGKSIVVLLVAPHAMDAFQTYNKAARGEVLFNSGRGDKVPGNMPVIELTWNHTTLQALKVDKTITYLQVLYPYPDHMEKARFMYEHFGDEVPMHLEFVRFNGDITCSGLPLVRYTTEERLDKIIEFHENHDCLIANPHRYTLEEGGMKNTDKVQLDFKKEVDPKGLLNPGKMIAWDNPDFDFQSKRVYIFPGLEE